MNANQPDDMELFRNARMGEVIWPSNFHVPHGNRMQVPHSSISGGALATLTFERVVDPVSGRVGWKRVD